MTLLLAIVTVLLVIKYIYFQWRYQFWKRKDVPQLDPSFPFGNTTIFKPISYGESIFDICLRARVKDWPYFGIYMLVRPYFIPFNLDLVKAIMTQDFADFPDKGLYYNERDDPLTADLFSRSSTKWKILRSRFSPSFTPAKLKTLLPTLLDCAKTLKEFLETHNLNKPIEIRRVLYCYGMNVIGSCVFGVDCNTFMESGSAFEYYGNQIFHYNTKGKFFHMFRNEFPNIANTLRLPCSNPEVAKFFLDFAKQAVEYREKHNVSKKDFIQQLTEIRETGQTDGNSLTIEQIAAQCFSLFGTGFETSVSVATFALYELALNHNIQEKARKEIEAVLSKYDGEITYESLDEMTYLQQVLDETLRKYPATPFTQKVCTEAYEVPNTNLTLEKGIVIIVPIQSIQWDEKVFKDPAHFDPDRFSEENKKNRHPYSHIPFGEGPRISVGMSFGTLEFKLALITILKDYRVKLNPKTDVPLKIKPSSLVHCSENGVWLDMEKIST